MDWLLVAGSLAAVLVLAGIAWLISPPAGGIESEAGAIRTAEEAHAGFRALAAVVSEDKRAALVAGEAGEAVLIKLHGTQPASRRLVRPLDVEVVDQGLIVSTGERMFGPVRLRLDQEARDRILHML